MLNRQKSNIDSRNKLYLVGTPIGNLDDFTYRAIETLKKVDIIYCEDTRITGMLLKHFDIHTPLKSYNVITENDETIDIINNLKKGKNIAVVSDAGMPGISDPGFVACVQACEEGFSVVTIPGVSACLTGLVASTLSTNHFMFYGFLAPKTNQRKKELESLKNFPYTIIFHEAPHRIKDCLNDMKEILGNRKICLARELTKQYEEYLRGTIEEVLDVVDEIKGEMIIIVEGEKEDEVISNLNALTIKEHYEFYLSQNLDPKTAMKNVAADRKISKSIIYQEIKGKNKTNI